MASANVDLVRSIYAGWERGDFSDTDWADPDIQYGMADGPEPGQWRGVSEMRFAFRTVLSAWEDLRVAVDEYRELDAERVLVTDRRTGQGKTSGLELGQMRTEGATVWRLRGGTVAGLLIYYHRDRAFADLGLSTEGDSS
jgi:ketosteroid isomerase-like protein